MKKVYNIYDISNQDGVYVQTVTKEITAKRICREHNRNGERNYMYLQSLTTNPACLPTLENLKLPRASIP